MSKHYYYNKIKSTGVTYIFWVLGFHFAYLGNWGLLILYWITLGGAGFWIFIELFLIPGRVESINSRIYRQIEAIEQQEKEEAHKRHIESLQAIKSIK